MAVVYSRHLKGDIMKDKMADMFKKLHDRVKAQANSNKKLAAQNKTTLKKENVKHNVVVEKEVMKEPKTLPID